MNTNTPVFSLGVSDFMTSEPLLNAEKIIASGMDFIEPGLAKIAAMTRDEFESAANRLKSNGIRVLSANWFLPPSLKVTGPDVNDTESRKFLEIALARAERLGAKAIVFGSPASRSLPSGFSHAKGREQIVAFCCLCADVIRENDWGIRIALEHVNHTETNFINTFAEALDIVREVNRPEIGLAADFYHFAMESESTDILLEASDFICAAQLANPNGRWFPKPNDDIPGLDRFFQHLSEVGYTGGIAIEAEMVGDLNSACQNALQALIPFDATAHCSKRRCVRSTG